MTDRTPSHHPGDALVEAGIALTRAAGHDRLLQEAAQQLRRLVPHDALVIALADPDTGELRVAHHAGLDAPPAAAEWAEGWRAALDAGGVVAREPAPGQLELSAPMRGASAAALGVVTIRGDAIAAPERRREAERALAAVAAQAAAAVEGAALVRREEARRRTEAVARVAAGVARELRDPLVGIASAAQLLRFRAREDPVLERNVGRLLREVDRLNGLAGDLLEFGQPRPLELVRHDPDAIWDEVLAGHRGLLEQRALVLHRTRAAHDGPRWMLDRERMAQVFVNLLANAADAAPEATDLVLASSVLPGGAWRCALRNAGPAIPAEALPRVFDLFFSTKRNGTGVGLALCRRIVEEHGGTIALDSGDAGTVVTVTLPQRGEGQGRHGS
jgi:signal transduction histidine kinase